MRQLHETLGYLREIMQTASRLSLLIYLFSYIDNVKKINNDDVLCLYVLTYLHTVKTNFYTFANLVVLNSN